ncbi:MAG TPA: AarF/ABC1/UbiB kinase family protein [Thermoanaerobaculia bacterium]
MKKDSGGAWGGRLLDVRRFAVLMAMLVRTLVPPLFLRLRGVRVSPADVGARIRRAFERLGVTYVKLGQFLAMRFDILPKDVCRELARLFDAVPPMPGKTVLTTIEREFGEPASTLFAEFDETPLAAASIAQVHRATLHGGARVAVKVQRPRIREIFAADIRNLRRLARAGDVLRLLGPQSMVEAVEEFERFTSREMDFRTEANTAEKLRENRGELEDVPRIYRELTTSRVLTMEFIDAPSLSELIHSLDTGAGPPLDLERAIRNLANASLRQLFVTGFFHADPHPGNILIREDTTVVFVDFGIFGQLSAERREIFATYIENLAMGNIEQSYRYFVRLLEPTSETDLLQLRRDVHAIMRGWYEASREPDTPLAARHLGRYFGEFITAIRDNKVRMGLDTLLFWRALLALDSTALRFEAQFDLLGELRSFFEKHRPTPFERVVSLVTSRELATDVLDLARTGPANAARLLDDVTLDRPLLTVRREISVARTRSESRDVRLIAACIAGIGLLILLLR